jgi:hypothetical protein
MQRIHRFSWPGIGLVLVGALAAEPVPAPGKPALAAPVQPPGAVASPPLPPGVAPAEAVARGCSGTDVQRREWSRISTSWLGVQINRPGAEVRAQLPALLPGTGFVVEKIEAGGPAAAAGLLPHDVLWRFDEQLLINEAQLTVLLGLHEPGDLVRIEFYRGGKPMLGEVKLGEAPPGQGFQVARDGTPFFVGASGPQIPLHIVNVPSRSATVEHPDGRAVLTADEGGLRLMISDSQGRTIHEAPLFDSQGQMRMPEAWRERVKSLHSTLIESLRRSQVARPPRIRVIPPPAGAN